MPDVSLGHDLPCAQCAYNLRGLRRDQRCPECGCPVGASIQSIAQAAAASTQIADGVRMNAFDRACAGLAMVLGVILLVAGAVGLFAGLQASVTLPPVIGVLPALAGWGIVRSVRLAWRRGRTPRGSPEPVPASHASAAKVPTAYRDPIPPTAAYIDAEIDGRDGKHDPNDEAP